jgi:hypothetical protein
MLRNRRAAALDAPVISLVLLAALMMAGCASPVALKTAATRPAARAGARVNVIAYSINSDGPRFQAIVSGAVGDYGSAVTVDANGKADPEHGTELLLNLASGSFRLSIGSLEKKFVQAASQEPIYPRTCSTYLRVTAAAPIAVAAAGAPVADLV